MHRGKTNYGSINFFERYDEEAKRPMISDSKTTPPSRNRDMTPISAFEIYGSLIMTGMETAYQFATGKSFFQPVHLMPDLTLAQIEARALHPVIPELLALLKENHSDGHRFMTLLDALLDDPEDKKNYAHASIAAKNDIITIVDYALLQFSNGEIRESLAQCKEKIKNQIASETLGLR